MKQFWLAPGHKFSTYEIYPHLLLSQGYLHFLEKKDIFQSIFLKGTYLNFHEFLTFKNEYSRTLIPFSELMQHAILLIFFSKYCCVRIETIYRFCETISINSFNYHGWIQEQANMCKEWFISKKYWDFNTAPHTIAYFLLVIGFQHCLLLMSSFSCLWSWSKHIFENLFLVRTTVNLPWKLNCWNTSRFVSFSISMP